MKKALVIGGLLIVGLLAVLVLAVAGCGNGGDRDTGGGLAGEIEGMQPIEGFVDLYWDAGRGRLLLAVPAFGEPLLYQSALARGVGSNDLGLDRGQLGATRVVQFERSGPKVLLVEENLRYRASGEDAAERQAVRESFARSVLWGFESLGEHEGATIVDATDFFLRDAHEIGPRLAEAGEGAYQPEASRSAIYLPRTKAFPDNTEIEAVVTYTGKPTGQWLPNGPRTPSIRPGAVRQTAALAGPTARTVCTSRSGFAGSPLIEIGTSPAPKAYSIVNWPGRNGSPPCRSTDSSCRVQVSAVS